MNPRVTQSQIARQAGVSVQTVSLALRSHPSIPAETRDRIQAIATKLGYRPDPALQALVAYRSDRAAPGFHGALAYVTNWPDGEGWRNVSNLKKYFESAQSRAGQLGYQMEHFSVSGSGGERRLDAILRARGVRGIVLGPLPAGAPQFSLDWSRYAVVSMGHSLAHLPFHVIAHDFRGSMHEIMRRVLASGRSRPGLYVEEKDEKRLGWRWQSAFQFLQSQLPVKSRIPVLSTQSPDQDEFMAWAKRYRPDALITVKIPALSWIREAGWKVPEEIAFISMDIPPEWKEISGINQNPEYVGRRATDMIDALIKNNEIGIPEFRQILVIEGSWRTGRTFS